MTYAMEKFAGNSKMTSVCLNHKLNKKCVVITYILFFRNTEISGRRPYAAF